MHVHTHTPSVHRCAYCHAHTTQTINIWLLSLLFFMNTTDKKKESNTQHRQTDRQTKPLSSPTPPGPPTISPPLLPSARQDRRPNRQTEGDRNFTHFFTYSAFSLSLPSLQSLKVSPHQAGGRVNQLSFPSSKSLPFVCSLSVLASPPIRHFPSPRFRYNRLCLRRPPIYPRLSFALPSVVLPLFSPPSDLVMSLH